MFNKFKRKKISVKDIKFDYAYYATTQARSSTLYYNDMVNIVHDATKICWDKPPAKTYEDKLKYIAARVECGHESVLEHTNLVMFVHLSASLINSFIEASPFLQYLNYRTRSSKDGLDILIGGSLRGYKHLIRETPSQNTFVSVVRNELYKNCVSCFFVDLIEAGIIEDKFISSMLPFNVEYRNMDDEAEEEFGEEEKNVDFRMNTLSTKSDKSQLIEITNIDPIDKIYSVVCGSGFGLNDIMDMCTVTVLFKQISRAAATQLCRHRNAQTWESQRYVNYSNAGYVDPAEYESKYDSDRVLKFDLQINDKTTTIEATNNELGRALIGLYPQLIQHGYDKQDARGILPMNVRVTKIYMTFTFRHLAKFLELRMDKHAQSEIRKYAEDIKDAFYEQYWKFYGYGDITDYLIPGVMYEKDNTDLYKGIDEDIAQDTIVEDEIDDDY